MLQTYHATRVYRTMPDDMHAHIASDTRITESITMRQNLTEQQIDDTIEDSFPASDPPAWY